MLKKEARQITGGLSAPNKMPGPSINLPAWNCITGVKLQAVKGSVCAGCYAMKGRYRFKNVKDALDRRLTALTDPRWVDAMVTLITGEKWFRWHDSGDIQSIEHLENIFRVCRRTPETQHWMPTREAQFIKRLKVNQVPRNLIIRFSSHMIDQGPVNFWPWTSTVVTAGKTCPAAEQNNECKDCRQCWDRSVKNVAYGKH
jgi:hypothetical protein